MQKNCSKKENLQFEITECGEFIPTYFTWITLERQKKRAQELNDMTKNNK